MALERRWVQVPPQSITSNGTVDGHLGVPDSRLFHVKQEVILFSDDVSPLIFEIKRINSLSDMELGPKGNIVARADLTLYLVSENAQISANEQERNTIRPEHLTRAAYQEEPAVAWRTLLVDPLGNFYDDTNPFPIIFDGDVQVGNVRITAEDGDPLAGDVHSSVRLSDGINEVAVNSDKSINVHVLGGAGAGATKYTFAEVSLVSQLQANVVSYTVPVGKTAVLETITASGQQIGRFDVFLNSLTIDVARSYYGNFNVAFDFRSNGMGRTLVAGDVITLMATITLDDPGLFSGRIQVVEST